MLRTHTIALLLSAVSALATTQTHASVRTFVSAAIGSDDNATLGCTAVAPCRLFSTAMVKTDVGGEVIVVDSGSYDPVTITKSISLIAPKGVYAGISVPPKKDGIKIAAPGINVVLRGLTIIGQGGDTGINKTAGNDLTVENCEISNLQASGIAVTGDSKLQIIDTIVRRNGQFGIALRDGVNGTITRATVSDNANVGILADGSIAGFFTVVAIADSTLSGNLSGVVVSSAQNASVDVSVRGSSITNNSQVGLAVRTNSFGIVQPVTLVASNNNVSYNDIGIESIGASARVIISGNTISRNTTAGIYLPATLSVVFTLGNNVLYNSENLRGTGTFLHLSTS